MKLDELEKLADAATFENGKVLSGKELTDAMNAVQRYNLACHPTTIKQLIALVRLQHEALMSCSMGCSYDVTEVVAATKAYEAFERGE